MQIKINRYLLLFTGVTIALIGLAYCVDPNLLLSRYGITVVGISEDNMYRGAYGGLFVTLGIAMAYGFFSAQFQRSATLLALLFMGGFAIGRVASIALVGMPHDQILSLLIFEIATSITFAWLLFSGSKLEQAVAAA